MTTIGRVHLRTDTDDALATRMRGESALRALDLEPPAMPPRVILCIRAMADPMPGGLDLRSAHAPRATEWEHAARNAIRDALHRAVRVTDGFVPPTADSVLFDDRAELLACAARDVVRGSDGWWWRHLLRGSVTFTVVLREWMREPEYVAAALEILAASAEMIAFVRRLEAHEAIALLHNVLRAHALEPFANEIIRAVTTPMSPSRSASAIPTASPWRDLVPEIEHGQPAARAIAHDLALEQRLFAGITLALRRAPTLVRRRESFFTQQTIAWIATMRAIEKHESTAPKTPATQTTPTPTPHEPPTQTPLPPPHAHHAPANTPDTPSRQHSPGHRPRATDHSEDPETRKTPKPTQQPTPVAAPTVSTQYAGIFFLLNVAIALELYDPYSDEGLDLDVWTFLALTARALLEEVDEEDNVWALLADLAQPESSCGAAGFSPPVDAPLDTLDRVRELLALTIEADHPALFLIRRYGRITLTPAHLDVHFSLAAHPIEIRMSGLDRDPGWIPAAGRHVNFHFD